MITLTTPESRAPATTARCIGYRVDADGQVAIAYYSIGYTDGLGAWVETRQQTRRWGTDGQRSWQQLQNDVPHARALAAEFETAAIALGDFSGTVG